MCVKCGKNHKSTSCTKLSDLQAKFALCKGPHPANYKGCTIYKWLTRRHNNISNEKRQKTNAIQLHQSPRILNTDHHHQHLATENPTKLRSYANVTEGLQSFKPNPTPINNNGISLLKLLDEFKSILYHLISLLTTVLSTITKNRHVMKFL